ncbi:MAG TPA: HD domain-containing protein [Longimicrobiaceae bacterium]|nr:HD domain-containing protein [Longimicrobiaceae bacterium]
MTDRATRAGEAEDRLVRQLDFIWEIDRLKGILRQTRVLGGERRENSAEHSWHLAVMAPLLAEYVAEPVDVLRVLKMVLIHDLVEIDADDVFCYDGAANVGKAERELLAAKRLFGLLPPDQARELRALWNEFEAGETPEARFAIAVDRLQPLIENFHSQGGTWRIHGITLDQVLARMEPIRDALPDLWPYVMRIIEESCARGYIRTPQTGT